MPEVTREQREAWREAYRDQIDPLDVDAWYSEMEDMRHDILDMLDALDAAEATTRGLTETLRKVEALAKELATARPSSSAWRGAYRNVAEGLRAVLAAETEESE